METYIILIICAAVAVLAILLCICIVFRKKSGRSTEKDILIESKELISKNAQTIEVLKVLASGKQELVSTLNLLEDRLRYLTPSVNEKVVAIDRQINDCLGDFKIALNKNKEDGYEGFVKNIKMLIADRSVLTEK